MLPFFVVVPFLPVGEDDRTDVGAEDAVEASLLVGGKEETEAIAAVQYS